MTKHFDRLDAWQVAYTLYWTLRKLKVSTNAPFSFAMPLRDKYYLGKSDD